MNSKYLSEAFKQLDLLNEEDFALNDKGIEDLEKMQNEDSVFDTLDVIDADAETEEDLQDSYIGKVILECCVCHSKIYENKEDVNIGEEECANVGEECPYCYSTDGYKVIGQVEPFEAPTEFNVEVEPKEECEDGECEDDIEVDEEDIDEKYCPKCKKDVDEPCEDCKDEIEESLDEKVCPDCGKDLDKEEPCEDCKEEEKKDESLSEDVVHKDGKPFARRIKDMPKENEFGDFEDGMVAPEDKEKARKEYADWVEMTSKNEGLENLDIETEHDRIHIAAEEKPETDDEMLAPLSPDTEEAVGLVNSETKEEVPEAAEEPVEEGGEDVDIPIDDFDEEGFDELGESFLKKVYENVNTFKTTGVTSKGNTLTVEGKINFASGKSKNTKFVFEAAQATKEGKVKFTGFNEGLTSGKKSFRLNGKVDNNRLTVESLGYHFVAKDASGKTGRVNGTVRVK